MDNDDITDEMPGDKTPYLRAFGVKSKDTALKDEDTVQDENSGQDSDPAETPETVEDEAPVKTAKPKRERKRGVGFGALLFMSLLAAGAGAVGGAVLPHYWDFTPPQSVKGQSAQAQSAANMNNVQSELTTLKAQMGQLANAAKSRPAADAASLQKTDLAPLEARLAALETRPAVAPIVTEEGTVIDPALIERLDALEAAAAAQASNPGESAALAPAAAVDLSPLESRVKALEGALAKTGDMDAAAADMISRLEGLEQAAETAKAAETEESEDVSGLEARLAALESIPAPEPLDLTDFQDRIAALEALPVVAPADVSGLQSRIAGLEGTLSNIRAALPLPAFPREDVLAALAQDGQSQKGWIGRAISKHVKVADEETAQLVASIEKSLAADEIDTALALTKTLPENGRAAAQDWIDAVSAQRKLP